MVLSIILASIVIFFLRSAFFLLGVINQSRHKKTNLDGTPGFISIIVPARNEELNIFNCINSIHNNNFPVENYEIIAINDRSTDSTGAILSELNTNIKNLKIITVTNGSQKKNLKGKAGALQAGISESKGDIILMTDADCIVNPEWINTIASKYRD